MKYAGLVFLALLAPAAVKAQNPPTQPQLNTVYVASDGQFEAAPDTAVVRFSVAAQESTSRAAYDKTSAAVEKVRQALRSSGIDVKLAQVGFYSVQPVYDWKNPRRTVIAYRVTTDVSVKLHDFSKLAPVLEQTADIEEATSQSLSYTLENMDAARNKATEDGFNRARGQAQTIARAGSRTLGELLYASVDVYSQPIAPVYTQSAMRAGVAAQPAPTAEFTPQVVTVTAHVNALFALK